MLINTLKCFTLYILKKKTILAIRLCQNSAKRKELQTSQSRTRTLYWTCYKTIKILETSFLVLIIKDGVHRGQSCVSTDI